MEYRLCEAKTARKLERTVNQLLGVGWRPLGGVAVVQSHNTAHWWYYQAMTRDEAPPRPVLARTAEFAKPSSNGLGDLD